jgi:hypothetical protein
LEFIMETTASSVPPAPVPTARTRRRPFFLLGVILFLAGPIVYYIRLQFGYLGAPWYVPVLATFGAVLMLISVINYGGRVRIGGLVLLTLICGFEWFVLLVAAKTPHYTGPAEVGRPLPAFTTALAGGTPFSNQDIGKGTSTVLLFFRGRW